MCVLQTGQVNINPTTVALNANIMPGITLVS